MTSAPTSDISRDIGSDVSRDVTGEMTSVPRPELADVGRLARRGVRRVMRAARQAERTAVGDVAAGFLGEEAAGGEIVSATWAAYEMVNVQRGLDEWLADQGRTHRAVGVHGFDESVTLAGMLTDRDAMRASAGPVQRVHRSSGPNGATTPCVERALYLVEDERGRCVVFVRAAMPSRGYPRASVEVLTEGGAAEDVVADIRRLAGANNVFRGQILSFTQQMFEHDNVLTFHPRPTTTRADLVLDDDLLARIERQAVGVSTHRGVLQAAGQHLKRGLLLYGPPGVGKTHTVRYLMASLPGTTVVQVSGAAMDFLGQACSVARQLQPAMIVVEDVDLIAEERGAYNGNHPMLFQLLDEMDGLAGDADVMFVLSTNRADVLEPALAARPGRIDQAVELELPDLDARRRLFDLYRGRLRLEVSDAEVEAVLAETEGVTASFLKELLRRSALVAAERIGGAGELVVTGADLRAAADELLAGTDRLTRTLLGGGATAPEVARS